MCKAEDWRRGDRTCVSTVCFQKFCALSSLLSPSKQPHTCSLGRGDVVCLFAMFFAMFFQTSWGKFLKKLFCHSHAVFTYALCRSTKVQREQTKGKHFSWCHGGLLLHHFFPLECLWLTLLEKGTSWLTIIPKMLLQGCAWTMFMWIWIKSEVAKVYIIFP